MAETPTPPPVETTSYSDPLYDRLDTFAKFLGRNWLIFTAAIVVAIVAAVVLRQTLGASPDAASATALQKARFMDQQDPAAGAVQALIENPEITTEFRARAALELATKRLNEGNLTEAKSAGERAINLAESAGIPNLRAASMVTMGAILERANDLEGAYAQYQTVVRTWRGDLLPYTRSADIALGALAVRLADQKAAAGNSEEATALRMDALRTLSAYAGRSIDPASQPMINAATWRYHDVRRKFPDLAAAFDQEEGITTPAGAVMPLPNPAPESTTTPEGTPEAQPEPSDETPAAAETPAEETPAVESTTEATTTTEEAPAAP